MSRPFDDEGILRVVRDSPRGPMKPKAISRALNLSSSHYRELKDRLSELTSEGRLYRVKGGRYAVPERISLVTGRVSLIRKGDGFVRSEETGEEVFVPERDLESALDGDRVVVRVESHPKGRKPVGRVIRILEREREALVAVFHEGRKASFAVPRDPRVKSDVVIPWGDEGDATEGDVVRVSITGYGPRRRGPVGEVVEVLGRLGDPGVDVLSVLHDHGLAPDFPPEVEEAARRVAEGERPEPGEGREDLRHLRTMTIDPEDAKDHDDALSIEPLEGGRVRVGIHIADVGWYVRPGSELDREARSRGTSVYLVDRVVPMLPHALSSDLCSLVPDRDRYAVSLLVDLDADGQIESHRFARSLIRSRSRLAYETVQAVLDGDQSVDMEVDADLRALAAAARTLRKRKDARGALDFDLPEARVRLDAAGDPVAIERVARLEAHRLVEDFMLLANEVVAREGSGRSLPVLYRIHEPPAADRLDDLRDMLARFGYRLVSRSVRPRDLLDVLEAARDRPEEQLVSTVVLRAMQRARYSDENLGHFGLALDHYAHFTSPIRRYPDLVTHRAIVDALVLGREVPASAHEGLAELAEHCSFREEVATAAERDSVELKKIEYMERHLGDEFDGTISGVKAFGAFVQLDDVFVDGLVHVNALEDDYYEFREKEYALVGVRKGRRLRLGDRVRVQLVRVDREERHLDFALVSGS
jgi:ribonuclease R